MTGRGSILMRRNVLPSVARQMLGCRRGWIARPLSGQTFPPKDHSGDRLGDGARRTPSSTNGAPRAPQASKNKTGRSPTTKAKSTADLRRRDKIFQLAAAGDRVGLLKLLVGDQRPNDSVKLYTMGMSVCVKAGDLQGAQKLLGIMKERGMELDAISYGAIMAGYASKGDWRAVQEKLEEMRQTSGLAVNDVHMTSLLKALCLDGQWDTVRGLMLRDMQPLYGLAPTKKVFNDVLAGCRDGRQGELALELVQAMKSRRLTGDSVTHHRVVACLVRSDRYAEALDYLRNLEAGQRRHIIKPCYDQALRACGQLGDITTAQTLVQEMTDQGFEVEGTGRHGLLCAALRCQDGEAGRRVMQTLVTQGTLRKDGQLCRFALSHCLRHKDRTLANLIVDGGLPSGLETSKLAMTVLAHLGEWDKVLRLANVLMNGEVALDDDACLLVLRAYAARKQGKQALHFFLRMHRTWGVVPSPQHYYRLMQALSRANMVGKALEMLREYRESGRVPSRDMVLLCASGCATHGQWPSVQTLVLEDLKALGYEVGVEGYLALLTAFAHGGEPDIAHSLLKELEDGREAGVWVNVSMCSAVMDGFVKAGRPQDVLQLFDSLPQKGLVPDLVAYTRGLQACAQLGDVARAEAIVSAMQHAGLAWQDSTLTSVMNVYAKAGDVEGVLRVYREAEPRLVKGRREAHHYSALIGAVCQRSWAMALYLLDEALLGDEAQLTTPGLASITRTAFSVFGSGARDPSSVDSTLESLAGGLLYMHILRRQLFSHWSEREPGYLDVHHYSAPMARVAVHSVLHERGLRRGVSLVPDNARGLTIITGMTSSLVREEVVWALANLYTPPLRAVPYEDNPGRLLVPREDIEAWLDAQRQTPANGHGTQASEAAEKVEEAPHT